MVDALEATGALDDVAEGIISVTGGDRAAELLGILWVAGIGSGLVDNILITAAMIPVVDALAADDASVRSRSPCYGGNATIVAAAAHVAASGSAARAGCPIGFLSFLKVGLPVTFVSLVGRQHTWRPDTSEAMPVTPLYRLGAPDVPRRNTRLRAQGQRRETRRGPRRGPVDLRSGSPASATGSR